MSDPDIDAAFRRITNDPELADLSEQKLPEPRAKRRNRLVQAVWLVPGGLVTRRQLVLGAIGIALLLAVAVLTAYVAPGWL